MDPERSWGLVRNEDGTLTLLNSEGGPSNHSLSDDRAAHIIRSTGIDSEDLMIRWDSFASIR